MQGHSIKVNKYNSQFQYLIKQRSKMNNKIFVHVQLNPKQNSNQNLHKHILAFVFSLHFLSKFINKIFLIELLTFATSIINF